MKTILYDTSVLLPLIVEAHPNHEDVYDLNNAHINKNANVFIVTHTIAEFYRHITSGRKYLMYDSDQAHEVIKEEIVSHFSIVDLTTDDYLSVIKAMNKLSLVGAIVYDGLVAYAAQKIEADEVVTYNIKDFQRVWPLTNADLIEP
jgi:predicted nucleic acid-binding protein